MTDISKLSPAPDAANLAQASAEADGKHVQRLARLTGFLFLATYATSIPPFLYFYVPALKEPTFVLGAVTDNGLQWGALLEMLLIAANIGTALTLYPVLRKYSPVLSLGFVTARVMESCFIAVGIISLLTLNTLRQGTSGTDQAALLVAGQALVAIHDWTFNLGPGVVVGFGNGLILGYLMWQTRLVPRALSVLGLIGGTAILLSGAAVLLGYIEAASTPQIIATIPEFFWELFLGFWLLVKGFNAPALSSLLNQSHLHPLPVRLG
jgi:Domain of unknown function (DUF4386)